MSAVMEQIGRMSIEERQKLADWILEGIRNGNVTNAPKDQSGRIGLMRGKWIIPEYARDRQMDDEIVSVCEF